MANSSTLNKLYFDILVSKNKLPLLQTYYSNIKNEILTDLTDLYNYVISAQSWVDAQITYLNNTRTEQATSVNNFIASSSDSLITTHPKYLEMMERYNQYVTQFYTRIHSLENEGVSNSYTVDNFNKNEIGQISNYWKFHYVTRYDDALSVEHKFCALNITSESDLLELSNNRYLYTTNENAVYDVDYNTKDVYINYLDKYIINGITDDSKFHTIFSLADKNNIYAFVVKKLLSSTEINNLSSTQIIGDKTDGSAIYSMTIFEYNSSNHEFKELSGNTSTFYITGTVLNSKNKMKVVNTSVLNDFYYAYISNYVIRFKADGTSNENIETYVQTYNNSICDIEYFKGYFIIPLITDSSNLTRVAAVKQTLSGLLDSSISASVTLNSFGQTETDSYGTSKYNTDNQIIDMFLSTNVGGSGKSAIYVVTNTNIWYFDTIVDNATIVVQRDMRKTNIGITDYSFLDNKGSYLIDEFGYFYVLKDNTYIYCAKNDDTGVTLYGNVVQAPTRYADKLLNLKNIVSEDKIGYAFNKSENITKAQLGDDGNEQFIYAFIGKPSNHDNDILYCITETGKIAYCDIVTGNWNFNDSNKYCLASFTGNKNITAICEGSTDEEIFVALSNYNIIKVTFTELMNGNGSDFSTSNLIYSTSSGSKINAMVYLSSYKVLYLGDNSGYVSAIDLTNNSYHTADVTSKDYNETDKSAYAITKGDNAIGTVKISGLTTDGTNLIVMGAYGRVASCSLSTFKWTPYNTDVDTIPQYDSNIYFNGQYTDANNISHSNTDIECFINYNNSKLVIFTVTGEVYSCNLTTGVWTDCTGKIVLHNGSGFGPEIYNTGSILGNKTPKHVVRVGNIAFVVGEAGRLASINISTGGITDYKGTSATSVTGPNYSYTGEDIPESSILNFILSDNRGKLYLLGTGNIVLSYTIESNEVLIPTNNKLYYIARRQTKYDYLSSLLVRVTKGELSEKIPFYPPSEDDNVYGIYYQSSAYVFKNGINVWRLSATLDIAYHSVDSGVSYTTITDLKNSDIVPTASSSSNLSAYESATSMPQGLVDEKGRFNLLLNIGSSAFTYLLNSNEDNELSWYKLPKMYAQDELDTAKCLNNGNICIRIENGTYDIVRVVDGSVIVNNYGDASKFYDVNNDLLFTINNSLYYTDEDTNVELVSDILGSLKKYIITSVGIQPTTLVIEESYAGKNNNYTFVCNVNDQKILFITLHFITLLSKTESDNFRIYHKEIQLNNDSDISKINVKSNNDGTKGYLVVNYSDNTSEIVSMNSELYGEYVIYNFRTLNIFKSKIRIIDFDDTLSKIIIALYDTSNSGGLITHTNSIHSYTNYDAIENTPIRALTEPWKSCQVTLGNGSDDSIPNAVMIRLKFRNNPDDLPQDVISERLTLRYRVLITNVTDGKFVLYEVEKSVGSAKTDDDTGTVEPLVRVIAVDGFEDTIFELFTSKLDKYHNVKYSDSDDDYSFDFLTYIQRFTGSDSAVYQIKINPVNSLSSTIDAKFFIETYYQSANDSVEFKNSINLSEYKTGESYKIPNAMLRYTGILKSNVSNSEAIENPVSDNIHHKIQIEQDLNSKEISADTYLSIIRFDGNGLYDKFNCILMIVDGKYVVVPLSKNKKDIRFIFDANSSDVIDTYSDYTKVTSESGRTLHKMHNRSVFSKNVVNNPDYYVDYQNKGRIVSVEGNFVNRNGLFEVISTNDGNQKRIRQLSEIRDGIIWRNNNSAFDIIKSRELGYGYDIIDRYSIFEAPYNAISAWWVPAKGYITRGNERLLNFTYSDASKHGIGKKYDRLDAIENINSISNKLYAGGTSPLDNGLTSAANGSTNTTETVEAYTEMIDEKFPLENWKGFEWAKMCFIRKWRKVFIDKHIEYYYEVESPAKVTIAEDRSVTLGDSVIVTFNSIPYTSEEFEKDEVVKLLNAMTPSINKQLYMYSDVCNTDNAERDSFEGIGKETWHRATAWYYKTHSWKVIHDEVVYLDHDTIFSDDDTANSYKENRNLARTSKEDFERFLVAPSIADEWWVLDSTDSVNTDNQYIKHSDKLYELGNDQDKPYFLQNNTSAGAIALKENYPISTEDDGEIIGEHITNIVVPTVFDVSKSEALPSYNSLSTGAKISDLINKYKMSKLGIYSKEFDTNNLETAYAQVNATTIDNLAEDSAYEFSAAKTSDTSIEYTNNTIASLKLILNDVEKTIASKTINKRSSSTDNTWNYPYGTGLVIPSYLTDSGIKYDIDTEEHNIKVTLRQYSSIDKSETNKNKGWFIDYNDITYTVKIKVTSDGLLNIVSNDNSNKISIAAGTSTILDGYCGSGSSYYLRKLPITLTINNLVKRDGYKSVQKEFILWSYVKANISTDTLAKVNALLETSDGAFNLYKNTISEMYSSTYSFLTLNKDQRICNLADDTSIVERVFVKQFFTNEKTAKQEISWSTYLTTYSKTLNTFGNRTENTYPQTYNYLEFKNNLSSDADLKSEVVNSAHCWLKLETGTIANPNLKAVADSDTDGFIVSGKFYYEWVDGTIKYITFTLDDGITVKNLKDKGFISSSETVIEKTTKHDSDDYFDKTWELSVNGVSIDSTTYTGNAATVKLMAVEVLEYAETTDTVGAKSSIINTSTWYEDDTSNTGTGLSETPSAENASYIVTYVLANASTSGVTGTTDTANYKEPYSVVINAASGYKLPDSPDQIQIGSTGTLASSEYTYDRSYFDSETYIYNSDKTINDIISSLTVPSDTSTLKFLGYSLDGTNVITDDEKSKTLSANTYITIYKLYTKLTEARLTIPAEKVTANISITLTAIAN